MTIFAENALSYLKYGFAILPTNGKVPLIKGFATWRQPPSATNVAQWQRKFPNANVAYQANASGLLVIDADSAEATVDCIRIFGKTPGRVKTRRGEHLLYKAPAQDLLPNIDFRAYGLEADLKFGRGRTIVLAPPSLHPEGAIYSWVDCDASVIHQLPTFDVSSLQRFAGSSAPKYPGGSLFMRDGSRGQWLNDQLCKHAACCDSFDDLLDVATTLNSDLANYAVPPLVDAVVLAKAKKVWRDFEQGKIKQFFGARCSVHSSRYEMELLESLDQVTAPNAFLLLAHLKLGVKEAKHFALHPRRWRKLK